MTPLLVGLALAVVALAIARPHRRDPAGDTQLAQWAATVRRQLPRAFAAQQVAHAGPSTKGVRPGPRIAGPGRPLHQGWTWPIDLPGNSQAEDWDGNRIAAALNTGRKVAAAVELHHTNEGWAALHVWQTEPLAQPQPIPWKPGLQPGCTPPGAVCVGRQRDGSHIHFPIFGPGGALATLLAGRRGSGKSEAARLMVAQFAGWGWAPPIVIDLRRAGVDYDVYSPLLDRPIITTMSDAVATLTDLDKEARARAVQMRARGQQIIRRYTPACPLRPVIFEEVQDITGDKKAKPLLRSWLQTARPVGGAAILITQYPHTDNLDSTTRAQITNVGCGRVRTTTEANVALGPLPEGVGPQHLRLGPGGVVADTDDPELHTGRYWHTPPTWHRAHVAALTRKA